MLMQVRRWVPQRALVVVADSSFAVLTLLHKLRQLSQPGSMITRLRLDAVLYEPAPARAIGQTGRPCLKGRRLPTLQQVLLAATTPWTPLTVARWYREPQRESEVVSATAVWYHTGMAPVPIRWVLIRDPQEKFVPQALLSPDGTLTPVQMLTWFVQRWQLEVPFQEVRTHLGVETQRQWADLALARTTPTLFGVFTVVTLLAHHISAHSARAPRQATWYTKAIPTFADVLALVRSQLWSHTHFSLSRKDYELIQIPRSLFDCLTDTLCYAA